MTAQTMETERSYQGVEGSTTWKGYEVVDKASFTRFLRDRVNSRLRDDGQLDRYEVELRNMATTGMATEFVEKLLNAVPEPPEWEIGEALAECVLQNHSDGEVFWPWNTARDRRTPRASLPGADLVGFYRDGDTVLLLIGEVKTSSDKNAPPNVMYGKKALTWQLEENATRLDIQGTLLKWLRRRCSLDEHVSLYRNAVSRYVNSGGNELLLVGVLIRDTAPNENDVRSRAKDLAKKLKKPARVEIVAWYLPVPIDQWADLLKEGTR